MSPFVLLLDWKGFERDKYVHTVLEDNLLPNYLANCLWFGGKDKKNWRIKITGAARMVWEEREFFFTYLQVRYSNGDTESYLFPISFLEKKIKGVPERAYISKASLDEVEGYLVEAVFDPNFQMAVYNNILTQGEVLQNNKEILSFELGSGLADEEKVQSCHIEIDGTNEAFVFNNKYFFKLYRKLFEGINPEIEALRFFSTKENFKNIPAYCGSVNLLHNEQTKYTFGVLMQYINNAKDNWSITGDYLNDFIVNLIDGNFQVKENVFVEVARMGRRTAKMHDTLFDQQADGVFRPEQLDRTYRLEVRKKLEDLLNTSYEELVDEYLNYDEQTKNLAWQYMESKDKILNFIDQVLTRPFSSLRIRTHGDFHLHQILVNDEDTYFIDFEGEPSVPIVDRAVKHSPLRDVATMIRSYHYAVSAKLYNSEHTQQVAERDLLRASDRWYKLMRDTFMDEYFTYFGPHHKLLKNNNEVNYLLQFYTLEKAISELRFEMKNRPTWVKIPLKGILLVIREIEKLRTI